MLHTENGSGTRAHVQPGINLTGHEGVSFVIAPVRTRSQVRMALKHRANYTSIRDDMLTNLPFQICTSKWAASRQHKVNFCTYVALHSSGHALAYQALPFSARNIEWPEPLLPVRGCKLLHTVNTLLPSLTPSTDAFSAFIVAYRNQEGLVCELTWSTSNNRETYTKKR